MVNVLDRLQKLCDVLKTEGVRTVHCSKSYCKWNNVNGEFCTTSPYIGRNCSCITYEPRDDDNRNDLIHPMVKRSYKK